MLCALQNDSITPEPFKDDQVAQLLGQYSMRKGVEPPCLNVLAADIWERTRGQRGQTICYCSELEQPIFHRTLASQTGSLELPSWRRHADINPPLLGQQKAQRSRKPNIMWASSSGLRCKLHPDFAVQRLVSFQTVSADCECCQTPSALRLSIDL